MNSIAKFRNVNLELFPKRQGSVSLIFAGENPCMELTFGGLIPGSGEQVFKQNRTSDRLDESGFVTSLGFDLGLPLVTGRSFLLLTTFGTEYVTLRMRGKSTSQSFLKNCLSKY